MDSEGGLGGTSEGTFGPLACALIGYYPVEMDRFRGVMNDMEADMVKVRDMTNQLLSDAKTG
jgi:hypothetical protein